MLLYYIVNPNPAKPEPLSHQDTRFSLLFFRLCVFVPLWLIFLLRKQEFTR